MPSRSRGALGCRSTCTATATTTGTLIAWFLPRTACPVCAFMLRPRGPRSGGSSPPPRLCSALRTGTSRSVWLPLRRSRARTPVVAYRRGGLKDVIVDGVTGFLVGPQISMLRPRHSATSVTRSHRLPQTRGSAPRSRGGARRSRACVPRHPHVDARGPACLSAHTGSPVGWPWSPARAAGSVERPPMAIAREGAHTVVAARDAAALDATVGVIRDAGGGATAVPTDVSNADDVDQLFRVASGIGPPVALVCAAATLERGAVRRDQSRFVGAHDERQRHGRVQLLPRRVHA